MSIFTTQRRDSAPVVVEAAEDRPELWIPQDLAALYAELAPSVRESLNPLDASGWYDDLAGRSAFGSAPGAPLTETVRRGTLAAHLRDAFAASRYGGTMPGSVPAPAAGVVAFSPAINRTGAESQWLQTLKPVLPGDSPERDAARQRHSEDQARVPEFVAAVRDAALDVLTDRERAWEAHVHLATLDAARREQRRRQDADEAEQRRLAVQQCPVCLQSDPSHIGPILLRALVPGIVHVLDGVPALRSCAACWNIAADEHLARLADERVGAGKDTRRQIVARHLAGLNGGTL